GGLIVGAAVLAIWIVGNFRKTSSRRLLTAVASLSALATLLNPSGGRLWLFLIETVRMSRAVSEWQPLLTTPVAAWLPWFVVAAGVLLCAFVKSRPSLDCFAIAMLLAAGSFRVERLSPFFVVASLVLFSPTITRMWPANARSFEAVSRRALVVM